ncbi:hypothetical protein GCM10027317_35380 [Massilia agri]
MARREGAAPVCANRNAREMRRAAAWAALADFPSTREAGGASHPAHPEHDERSEMQHGLNGLDRR